MTGKTGAGRPADLLGRVAGSQDLVSFTIDGQLFGIPVAKVRDVLSSRRTTPIPLAPPEIAGSLNLRGRVVTMIDLRLRLGLAPRDRSQVEMSIVVEHGQDLYSLLVDSVGEVLALCSSRYERNPPTLDKNLGEYADGIYRLDDALLVVLDVTKLLDYGRAAVA